MKGVKIRSKIDTVNKLINAIKKKAKFPKKIDWDMDYYSQVSN